MQIIKVNQDTTILPLGRRGENEARKIRFDLSEWKVDYGPGNVSLIHQRSEDSIPYPVKLELDGAYAYWTVTNADTDQPGNGRCELSYYADGKDTVAKSVIYKTVVQESMNDRVGEVPGAVELWTDAVNKAMDSAKKAAEAADAAAQKVDRLLESGGTGSVGNVASSEEVTEMLEEIFNTNKE